MRSPWPGSPILSQLSVFTARAEPENARTMWTCCEPLRPHTPSVCQSKAGSLAIHVSK